MDDNHKPRIFLCHAKEDNLLVEELYHKLKTAGYDPWLDKYDLLPGQHWWEEIEKVIHNYNNLVVVCLSRNLVTKSGVVRKEINRALDVLDEMPEDTIYLIPARLEECRLPRQLSKLHWVDLFEPDGFEKLKRALESEIDKRLVLGYQDGLSPTQQVEVFVAAAWQYLHTDLPLSIKYVHQALELSLRLWGRSIGVDDIESDITQYLDHWRHFIDNRPPDDERDGLSYPYYFDVKGDYCLLSSDLFRTVESFHNLEESEDYVVEMTKAVKYFLEMAEQGLSKTYQEHRWENAIQRNQSTILSEVKKVSPKTARVLKFAEGHIMSSISKDSLSVWLFPGELFYLAGLSGQETDDLGLFERETDGLGWLSDEDLAEKGFDVEAIRSAICAVMPDFPADYRVTVEMPAKYAYLLEEDIS